MRLFILLLFLLVDPVKDVNKIARTNELKREAKEAFLAGNFDKAIKNYSYLIDSLAVNEDALILNLANSYYQNGDTSASVNTYSKLLESSNNKIASRSFQQLGVIKNKQKKQQEALQDFKQALKKDPTNEEARYNYEMLKKLLDEQKKEEQQKQDQQQQKDKKEQDKEQQQKQDQQQQQNQENQKNQDKQDQQQKQQDKEGKEDQQQKEEGEKSDEQKKNEQEKQQKNDGEPEESEENKQQQQKNDMQISPDKLKEMNISEEKAKMILEAMKNQEVQYLQQKKRKSDRRPPSGKPDW